jgi:hypothetical protein
MAERKKPLAKIQAGKKAKKFPWKIGSRSAGFHIYLLSNSGRYGRFRPYPGPLPDTPQGYVGITGSEIIFIIIFFSASSKEFFGGGWPSSSAPPVGASGRSPLHLLCPSPDSEMIPILIPRTGKILDFFGAMGYEDHERRPR